MNKPYSKHVFDRTGTISSNMLKATVDNHEFKIGDIIPYTNTRGNTDKVKIYQFRKADNGTIWFKGYSIKTMAEVHYPLHCSLEFIRQNELLTKNKEA